MAIIAALATPFGAAASGMSAPKPSHDALADEALREAIDAGEAYLYARAEQDAKSDTSTRELYPQLAPSADLPSYVQVITGSVNEAQVVITDSLFNQIAGKAIFKVNRTELRINDEFIRELTDVVIPYINRSGWALVGIDLRGAASPEGPYDNNVRLSKGRAKALHDYLCERLNFVSDDDIVTTTVAEDYAYLLWLLERDGDSAAPLLRRIIDEHGLDNPAAIKRDLQALYDGKYWRRLLKDYFPKVRAARVVLFFRRTNPIEAPIGRILFADAPEAYIDLTPVTPVDDITPLRLSPERRHALSISTNLLYDVFYMPNFGWAPMWNVGLEWYPKASPWTVRAQFTSPYYHRWSKQKFFQYRDYHIEVRRYMHDSERHTGLYLGAYGNVGLFGIGFDAKRGWQGEAFGGALKVGYVLPLGSSRWRIDFHAALGGLVAKYDPYVYGNPVTGEIDGDYYYDWGGPASLFRKRNHRFTWLGPTEIGITITYDVMFYRNKGGVSFKRKEGGL